jgi:hypothetical protein
MKLIQQSKLTRIQGGFVGAAQIAFGVIAIGYATGIGIYDIYQGIKGALYKKNDIGTA